MTTDPALLALAALLLPACSFVILAVVAPLRRLGRPAAYLSILFSAAALVAAIGAWRLSLVALISFLVQVYSLGYLSDEAAPSLGRYYVYQSLFAFSMMGLVLAPNFVQLFICWELVGLCSY